MTTTETGYEISDADAVTTLQVAVDIVQDVITQVHLALKAAHPDDANFLHKAELHAQRLRVEQLGTKQGERLILRAHPLFKLWNMALKAAALIERLLSVTNPKLFAQRMVAIDTARELVKVKKLAAEAGV
jgi:hypothetical protein